MKERCGERQLDIIDIAALRLVEAADVVFGIIGETIKNVDRLQRLRKGGSWYAKS